jgi:hypothetical protein
MTSIVEKIEPFALWNIPPSGFVWKNESGILK